MADHHIVLTGGGTLGPVTPLLAIVEEARRRNLPYVFSWVGTRDGVERKLVESMGVPFFTVPSGKWRRYVSLKNLLTPVLVCAGFIWSLLILRRLRPYVVISAGGYVSVPVCWAACLLRIPVVVHDQDVVQGLTIRLLQPCAAIITTTWTRSGRPGIGNLVRPSIVAGNAARARTTVPLPDSVPIVLVVGGGTGAQRLNELVVEALPVLATQAGVVHVTGYGKSTSVDRSARYVVRPFVSTELPDLYAAADVVVCRAGMGTLAELAVLSKAAVVVPLPNSHQVLNGAAVAARTAAVVLDQNVLTGVQLADRIMELLADAPRRARLGRALHQAIPDGMAHFLGAVESLTLS